MLKWSVNYLRQCVSTDGNHYYVSGCCIRHCCDRGLPCAAAECLFPCKGDYDYVDDDDTFQSDDATLFSNSTANQSIFSDDFTNNHSIFSNDTEPVTVSDKTARTHRSRGFVNKKNSGDKTSMRLQSINERNKQEMTKGSKSTAKSSQPSDATKSIPASSFLAATTNNKDVLGSTAENEQDGAAKAGETPDATSEVATEDFFGSLVAGAALGLGAAVAAKNGQNAAAKAGTKASDAPDTSGSEGAAGKRAPPPSFFDSIVMTRIASLPSIEEYAEEGGTSSTPSRLDEGTTSTLEDTGTGEPNPLSSAVSSTRSAKSSKSIKTAKTPLGSAKSFPGAFIIARSGTKKLDGRDDQPAAHEPKRGQIEKDDDRESVDGEEEGFRLNNKKKTIRLKTTVFNARRTKTSIKSANKIENEARKNSDRKLREELVVHRNSI